MFRLLFSLLLGIFALEIQAQLSIDTIIERSLRAFGGRQSFDNIEILYREGIMSLGMPDGTENNGSVDEQVKTWWVPFRGIKTEVAGLQGILGSVFTPNEAFRYHISIKNGDVEQFEVVPAYELKTMMDLYNKLSFIPELSVNTYNNVQNTKLIGFENIEDQRCFKLQFKENTIYLNEKTYLPVKLLQFFKNAKAKGNTNSFVEYYFYDYKRDPSGLVLPMRIEQLSKGNDIPIIYQYHYSKVNGDGPREEVLDVSGYKENNEKYINKMGGMLRYKKRKNY